MAFKVSLTASVTASAAASGSAIRLVNLARVLPGASRVARPTQPETPQRMRMPARGYTSPDEDDDDVLGGQQSRGGAQRGRK